MANPVTYESVMKRLSDFKVTNAANRATAEEMIEKFMDDIRPQIDQVLRENQNLTPEQKKAIDLAEEAIIKSLKEKFPPAAHGGKRRRMRTTRNRKSRSTRRRRSTRNRR